MKLNRFATILGLIAIGVLTYVGLRSPASKSPHQASTPLSLPTIPRSPSDEAPIQRSLATAAPPVTSPEEASSEETADPTAPEQELHIESPLSSGSSLSVAQVMAPEAAPSAPQKKFKANATLTLAPFYKFTSLRSTDSSSGATSNIASSLDAGLSVQHKVKWTPSRASYVHIKIEKVKMQTPVLPGKTLSRDGATLTDFSLGIQQKLGARTTIGANAGYGQVLYARAIDNQTAAIVSLPQVHAGSEIRWTAFTVDDFTINLAAQGAWHSGKSSENITAKSGFSYRGAVELEQDMGDAKTFGIEAFFETRSQNTSITEQKQIDLGLSLSYQLPFGKSARNSP
ncbi:MAG TPA: hypothetical protein VM901_13590 [Bdellovibrionota bacterium]|nr:hypothetical protein [Bdellovibrionota bacterium]